MTDLILTGGTVVNETASDLADVAITGGRVSAIGKPGSLGDAAEVVNVKGPVSYTHLTLPATPYV